MKEEYAAGGKNSQGSQAMIRGMSMSLEEGLRLETTLTPLVVFSRDFEEGITAFAEKRKLKFEGSN